MLLAFHQALSGLLSLFLSMIAELSCFCLCWCMIITGLIYLAFQGLNHISRTISDERSWHSQFLRTWRLLKWWLPLSHCGKKICFWPSFLCRLTKTAVISTHIEPNARFTPLGCRRLDHPTLDRQLVRNLIYLIVTLLILHMFCLLLGQFISAPRTTHYCRFADFVVCQGNTSSWFSFLCP